MNSMIQLLWDRGEANGYAWHMTRDPLPNTPRHTVLLHEAFGDHQVANLATEVEARLLRARLRTPALDPGRSLDRRLRSTASGRSRATRGGQRPGGVRHRAPAAARLWRRGCSRVSGDPPAPLTEPIRSPGGGSRTGLTGFAPSGGWRSSSIS